MGVSKLFWHPYTKDPIALGPHWVPLSFGNSYMMDPVVLGPHWVPLI